MKLFLGKKPRRIDRRTLLLKTYLPTLPPLPDAIDWSGKIPQGNWGMLGNDRVGDCAIVGPLHIDMAWTSQTGAEFVPTTQQALDAYSTITGYNPTDATTDQGSDMLTVMNWWRKNGIAGRAISAYAAIEPDNQQEVKASIALFGAVNIGVQLPRSAMDDFMAGGGWYNVDDTNIAGGHCIIAVQYNSIGPVFITWGGVVQASWAWLAKYGDEGYCPLSGDWISDSGFAPSGLNMIQLISDLSAVTQQPAIQ